MPRDESIVETAKQRSLRIPLDHFVRPDSIARTKLLLATLAAGLGVAYLAWLLIDSRAGARHASPGPLSSAHAAWNDDCQVCHVSFLPLRSDAVHLVRPLQNPNDRRQSLDEACIKCHAAAPHHGSAKADEVESCASCHPEHQGHSADIVRSTDQSCTRCHKAIDEHRIGASALAPAIKNVSGFVSPTADGLALHPEFRSLASDPGNVKFNHWLHLQPGIAVADAKRKFRLSDLDDSPRARYAAYASDGGFIQLNCQACHEPEAAGGAHMQTIRYEQHCRACHPLQFKSEGINQPSDVPHGLSADRLSIALDGLIFAAERTQLPVPAPSSEEGGDLPLVPGKTLGNNLTQKLRRDILSRRATAAQQINAKCQECHVARERGVNANESGLVEVRPSTVPDKWFQHARFDHSAHRHVECRLCHKDAYTFEQHDKPRLIAPSTSAGSVGYLAADDNEIVMIAGIESCAACHAPARNGKGGARHDCAECHAYHGREHALAPSASQPASPAARGRLAPSLTLVAQRGTSRSLPDSYVGAASCAAAACHGDAKPGSPSWRSAFTTFSSSDPHASAYDVLWTFRSREMIRLLAERTERPNDGDHLQAIQQRCIGCHATPLQDKAIESTNIPSTGVQCESCHGPAAGWRHEHYRAGFARTAASGFVDTKDLAQRTGACVACHVGPADFQGERQAVDHDLIAAGHPRLAFDFHAYFESLPAHWDRKADESRHPGDFHFKSWVAGQTSRVEQAERSQNAELMDFAQLDCFACHHQLQSPSTSLSSRRPLGPLEINTDDLGTQPLSLHQRIGVVKHVVETSWQGTPRWDTAVETYLAVQALRLDMKAESLPHLKAEIAMLDDSLEKLATFMQKACFPFATAIRPPTHYDSPTGFSVTDYLLHSKPIADTLSNLQNRLINE